MLQKFIFERHYRLLKEDMVRNFISNEKVFISEKIILSTFVDVILTNGSKDIDINLDVCRSNKL